MASARWVYIVTQLSTVTTALTNQAPDAVIEATTVCVLSSDWLICAVDDRVDAALGC